ncbi:UNVERIFIED_CONTAM: hypothetical protein RMT77_000012 [Armadillidium vulgare]
MSSSTGSQIFGNAFKCIFENTSTNNELLENFDEDSETFATESSNTLIYNITFRDWLLNILHSTKYQIVIVILVVLDTLIVISELFIDLELKGSVSEVPHILHGMSISLLSLFVVEIFLKIYAYKSEFFRLKGEVFDAVVVIVALALDSVYLHSQDAITGSGLIIVLRLWRIVRIQNSIVMSVRRSGEKKLATERGIRKSLEIQLEITKEKNCKLRQFCLHLLDVLRENQIDDNFKYSLSDLELDTST